MRGSVGVTPDHQDYIQIMIIISSYNQLPVQPVLWSWSTGTPNQSSTMSSTVAAAASGGAGQRDLGGMIRKRPSVGISEGKWPELSTVIVTNLIQKIALCFDNSSAWLLSHTHPHFDS